jgi:hypothetical protein
MPPSATETETSQPGNLSRVATFLHIPVDAWRFLGILKAKRTVNIIKNKENQKTGVLPPGKAIDATYTQYQTELKGRKEVLMAFYANESVQSLPKLHRLTSIRAPNGKPFVKRWRS